MSTIVAQICIRRDTAANFTSANPTLALGEIAYETDTRNIKVGDGATAWTALGYINPYRGGTADAPTSNTVLGSGAGAALQATSARNTAVGQNAFAAMTTGVDGTAIGRAALANATGSNNTALGSGAGFGVTTATHNTFIGVAAGIVNTANDITAVGANALDANTTGTANVAVGKDALGAHTTGGNNTAVGHGALKSSSTASANSAFGTDALALATTGASNTGIGYAALALTSSGANNIAVGSIALYHNTTGSNNTALGMNAGRYRGSGTDALTSATSSVFIGHQSRAAANSETNQVVIAGTDGLGNGSNTTTIGNSSTTGTFIPAGNLTLTNGNFIVGTAGKGIDFAITSEGTGTMTSELLSDYEEGTFTPTVSAGVTSPTYTTQDGHYTKIGRMVFFRLRLDLSGGTANATLFRIGGLPFTSSSSGGPGGAYVTYAVNWLTGIGTAFPRLLIDNSSTEILTHRNDTGSGFGGTDFNGILGQLIIQGQYFV